MTGHNRVTTTMMCLAMLAAGNATAASIVFEAEAPSTVGGTWELRGDDECSGRAMLYCGEGTGRNNGNTYSPPRYEFLGKAFYDIRVPADGRYVLWGLCWSGDQCSNSCWTGFDEHMPVYFPEGKKGADEYVWNKSRYKKWLWLKMPPVELKRGRHRMRVEVREDGFMIDQWALLDADAQAPVGRQTVTQVAAGPDEPWFRADPRSYVASAGGSSVVSLWLRQPSSGSVEGRLLSNAPAGVEVTLGSPTLVADDANPLARCDVTLAHPAGLPRGEHEYAFTLERDDAKALVAKTRMSRPFRWEVLAPMSLSAGKATVKRVGESQHAIPYTPPPAYWPSSDRPARGLNGVVHWQNADDAAKWFSPYGFLDFTKALGGVNNVKAFARTEVRAPKDGEYALEILTDDEGCAWVNNELVYVYGHAGPATDRYGTARIKLDEGVNQIAVAVRQRSGPWQMRLRIRGVDGSISNVR